MGGTKEREKNVKKGILDTKESMKAIKRGRRERGRERERGNRDRIEKMTKEVRKQEANEEKERTHTKEIKKNKIHTHNGD